jgi:hypothetical protein
MGSKYVVQKKKINVDTKVIAIVFSKDEIVFARTSPKHKLEIGQSKLSVYAASSLTFSQ